MHPASELLQLLNRSESLTRITHPVCELLSMFDQIRTTYGNDWICIQPVSYISVFQILKMAQQDSSLWVAFHLSRLEPIDKSGWPCLQFVSHSSVLEPIRITDHMQNVSCSMLSSVWADQADHVHSMWVTLQNLYTSAPLMRLAGQCLQYVSCSSVFEQLRTTDENG